MICRRMSSVDEDASCTHDWAFLAPLALPPDFPPPVILIDLGGVGEKRVFWVVVEDGGQRVGCWIGDVD